jgi:hypothetical protein
MPLDTIAAPSGTLMLSLQYDDTGLAWCWMRDSAVICWLVDGTSNQAAPTPVSICPALVPPVGTEPVLSPSWAVRQSLSWSVPGLWYGIPVAALFMQLATNNGALRKLYADFSDLALLTEWLQWSGQHPDLVLSEPPS